MDVARTVVGRFAAGRATLSQTARFAAVGLAATATHYLAVVFLMEVARMPLAAAANVIGVVAGSTVSYVGNCFWTFGASGRHGARMVRFAIVYGLVFALNGLLMLVAADLLGIPYLIPLVVSLALTPVVTYLFNRYWVFA